jgi:GDP-L-fucose synthase
MQSAAALLPHNCIVWFSGKLTDISKLHSLGCHHHVELDEGIARLYKWYLAQ